MVAITLFLVCLAGSLLTFFSGFGLGTLLLPTFSVFFPIEIAITFTAIVHFFNNVFKVSTLFRHVKFPILYSFGVTALIGAFLGANTLAYLLDSSVNRLIFSYRLGGYSFCVTLLNMLVGALILLFGLNELFKFKFFSISKKSLLAGGFFSGFFGGLSGHQGALRSAFLIHYKLSKEAFIACGVCIALIVDITRMTVYMQQDMFNANASLPWKNILVALSGAMIGVLLGRSFLKKITISWVNKIVHTFLIIMGLALISGIL